MDQPVRLYRIIDASDAASPFCGKHCMRGGRWTTPGIHAAYASTSAAGALLECLAHGLRRDDRPMLATGEIQPDAILTPPRYPQGWRGRPYSEAVRAFGDEWARSGLSLALRVPSALIENESNVIVNPEHPDFATLDIVSVDVIVIDPRLSA